TMLDVGMKVLALFTPVVTFLLVLNARQARISQIIRENTKQIVDLHSASCTANQKSRQRHLSTQNRKLFYRYSWIQRAIFLTCFAVYGATFWVIFGSKLSQEFMTLAPLSVWITGAVCVVIPLFVVAYEVSLSGDALVYESLSAQHFAGQASEPIWRRCT